MLRDSLTEAMKTALRAHDEATLGTVRMMLAKIKETDINARAKGNQEGISEAEISVLLQGMVKQRRESAALYEQGNRADLADKEKAEIEVIERFLPKQMTEAEMEDAIAKIVQETGASSVKEMGKVMGALKAAYAGKMDFSLAGPLVKKKLG